jgi:hypothetical protein
MCCAMAHALAHTSLVLRATVRCAAACTCAFRTVANPLVARDDSRADFHSLSSYAYVLFGRWLWASRSEAKELASPQRS